MSRSGHLLPRAILPSESGPVGTWASLSSLAELHSHVMSYGWCVIVINLLLQMKSLYGLINCVFEGDLSSG